MMKMLKIKSLNLETRYLLFCPFLVSHYGPYTVDKKLKLSDVNYTVNTPGRCEQKQLCHINMLKKYIDRDSSVVSSVNLVNSVPP